MNSNITLKYLKVDDYNGNSWVMCEIITLQIQYSYLNYIRKLLSAL